MNLSPWRFSRREARQRHPSEQRRKMALELLEQRRVLAGPTVGHVDLDVVTADQGPADLSGGGPTPIFTDTGQQLGDPVLEALSVAVGDLDGDGNPDAFIGNLGANEVWLGDGHGRFTNTEQALGDYFSNAVELADLDGDGDLDAFIANGAWKLKPNRVWLGDGRGGFTDSGQTLGDADSHDVKLADLDGDGNLDAFVANIGANRVWLGDGHGGFTDGGQMLGDLESIAVALADVDGDGDLDAFVTNYEYDYGRGQPNTVWLNDGRGRFHDSGQALGNSISGDVAMADLDADGDVDAFVANRVDGDGRTNEVWLNDGQGLFSDSGQDLGNVGSRAVALADVDGDGDVDALLGNRFRGPEGCRLWLGDGSGGFSDSGQELAPADTRGLALADLDGDGDADAIITGNFQHDPNRVWLNDGRGLFVDSGQPLGDSRNMDAGIGDLDGDGDLDAFIVNAGGLPDTVWLGDGQGRFVDSGQRFAGGDSAAVALGDLDGDGDLDAFVANGEEDERDEIWLNDGHAIFTRSEHELKQIDANVVALGDLDGDGDLDAVVSGGNHEDSERIYVYINDGQARFHWYSIGWTAGRAIMLGDVDADGDLDVFIRSGGNYLWFNDGQANFVRGDQRPGDANAFGDVDGDGDLDLVGYGVWLGDGHGRFSQTPQELPLSFRDHTELGDLDGDGDLDAFSGEYVWLNDGQGVFTDSGQQYPGGDVALDDLDGDGDLDAFVVSRIRAAGVWLNGGQRGTGTFADSGQNLGVAILESEAVELGDFDGDGDLDAFVVNSADRPNRVWINDGSGNLTDSGQWLGKSSSSDVAIGDLDGDGNLDAVVANGSHYSGSGGALNTVWLGDGHGRFTDTGQRLGHSNSNAVAMADLNGDGHLDAFVGNFGPNRVWFGDGTGLLHDGDQSLGDGATRDVALGDLDGDGDLDAFAANSTQPHSPDRVWLNDGLGRFTDGGQAIGDTQSSSVALGDVDGDGNLDAFVDNQVWLNDGGGQFGDPRSVHSSWGACIAAALGDLDGDGDLDAYLGNGDYHGLPNEVAINDGQGNFATAGDFNGMGDGETHGVALGDLDGDGDLDAFAANVTPGASNEVWLNDGRAGFTDNSRSLGQSTSHAVALGDFNGDGLADAFVCHSADEYQLGMPNRLLLGDRQGNFHDTGQDLGGEPSNAVAVGDLDGDGNLDAFVGNHGPNQVWLGDGTGTLHDSGQRLGDGRSWDVALGDLDGDGDLDAFVTNFAWPGEPDRVWLNDGQGRFTATAQDIGDDQSLTVSLGDVDGDGDLDALVGDDFRYSRLYFNNGRAGFSRGGRVGLPFAETFPALGDLDGDGDLDAFLARDYAPDEVWLNDGQGNFTDSGQTLGSDHVPTYSVALGDVDGDGDLDAFVGNGASSLRTNKLWLGDGLGGFTDSGQRLGGGNSFDVALADLDADGDLDAFVANTHAPDKVWLNRNALVDVDLAITKTDGQVVAVPGGPLCYTITVSNNGPADVIGAEVTDLFPPELIDVSWTAAVSPGALCTASGNGDIGRWIYSPHLVDLPVGGSITYTVNATLAADASGTLTNRAIVTAPTGYIDPTPENNAASDTDTLILAAVGGSGIFVDTGQQIGSPILNSRSIASGDLDGDGDLDALFGSGDTHTVWLNDGYGTLIDVGHELGDAHDMALGDLDGDGDLDALVTTNDGNRVWLGDGQGRFTDGQSLGESSGRAVALGDLDGDGDLDAFFGYSDWPGIPDQVWLNDGQGRFSDTGQHLGLSDTQAVVLGDLDQDGDLDALTPGNVWINDGQAGFSGTGQGLGGSGPALGDFDGDGDLDALITHAWAGDGANVVWVNDGHGHFTDSGLRLGRSDSMAVALADLDDDGHLDAFVANYEMGNTVWLGDGQGNFVDSGQSLGGLESMAVTLGDFDGDGDLDALVGNTGYPNNLWLNDGQARFTDSGQGLDQSMTEAVALGDLDGDGHLDAFVANYGPNRVWLGDGDGRFHDTNQSLGHSWSQAVALADLDGDGDLDALAGNIGENRVWLNDGQGVFHDAGRSLSDVYTYDLALGDLDGDGDLDAFVGNGLGDPNTVWLGDGQGTFTDSGQRLDHFSTAAVALGDFDGDGDLDAFVANNNGAEMVWLNDGHGRFTDSGQRLGDATAEDVTLGDVDGDGDLDAFVTASWFHGETVWLNDGHARFTARELADVGMAQAVCLGDLDGDGDLDALLVVCGGDLVWLGDAAGNFTDTGRQLGDGCNAAVAFGDLDGDGDLDAFIGNSNGGNRAWLNQDRPAVVARHVFYNNSAFDGDDPAANPQDDAAVAPDPDHAGEPRLGKTALLPCQTATFQNYTSYSRGINGIMVDIVALPGAPTADDFQFAVGNDDDPANWLPGPPPSSVTVRPGAGVDGSDRITLIWPDNAIQKQWLQVTVLATAATGLAQPDLFYFGNAIGESGNSTTDAKVNVYDMLGARDNQRHFLDPAPIDFPFDFNRDARVNALDMMLARGSQTHWLNLLHLITVPCAEAKGVSKTASETSAGKAVGRARAAHGELGRISGSKFNDLDGDGVRGQNEPGLADWTIYLDLDRDGRLDPGEPSTGTDAEGNYQFTGLAAGDYVVAEQPRPDWQQTFPTRTRGPEFLVGDPAFPHRAWPDVAMDPLGNFVIAWQSANQDGDDHGIYAQRFRADAAPLGDEFQVNSHTASRQVLPAVAMDSRGNFVIAWESRDQDGDDWGIYAQIYDAHGQRRGDEFQVNTSTAGQQEAASVAMAPGGEFVIAWMGPGAEPRLNESIYAQMFNADGSRRGSEFRVNSFTDGRRLAPSVAIAPGGEFVIAFSARDAGASPFDNVFARTFHADGTPYADEFQVDTIPLQMDLSTSVAMDGAGNFVVVFDSDDLTDGPGYLDVHARLYHRDGTPRGPDFQVNSEQLSASGMPSVAMDDEGRFVVVWKGDIWSPQDSTDVYARTYRPDGTPYGGEFAVSSPASFTYRSGPVVAIDDAGGFVTAWGNADCCRSDVMARRLVGFGFENTHRVVLDPGQTVEDLDFGNRRHPQVVGRHVFYNNSAFDGNDPAANELDDGAIAIDKTALLPCQTASFANYTSYGRGINGVMVDIAGLPGLPTADDFQFRIGNDNDPAGWGPGPEPSSITVRPGAGVDGSDRITLIWPDDVVAPTVWCGRWLQVTVLPTANTGLTGPDVFYFGSAIGETGNSTTDAKVNAIDMLGARDNQRHFLNPAPIDFPYDFNRDARVNVTDMMMARGNMTHWLCCLRLITVPCAGKSQGGSPAASASAHDAVLRRPIP